jgi:hypothetical protein
MRAIAFLITAMFTTAVQAQTVGPMPVNTATVLGSLPIGAVLLFDKAPSPAPEGWASCGVVRLNKEGGASMKVDCLHKTK